MVIAQHKTAGRQGPFAGADPSADKYIRITIRIIVERHNPQTNIFDDRQGARGVREVAFSIIEVNIVLPGGIANGIRSPAHHIQILVAVTICIEEKGAMGFVIFIFLPGGQRSSPKPAISSLYKQSGWTAGTIANEKVFQAIPIHVAFRQQGPQIGLCPGVEWPLLKIITDIFPMLEIHPCCCSRFFHYRGNGRRGY